MISILVVKVQYPVWRPFAGHQRRSRRTGARIGGGARREREARAQASRTRRRLRGSGLQAVADGHRARHCHPPAARERRPHARQD